MANLCFWPIARIGETSCKDPTQICKNSFQLANLPLFKKKLTHKNCMVEHPRNQVLEMHVDKNLLLTFQCWKTSFKIEVCSCSGYPSVCIKEVEMVESVDDPKTSQSNAEYRFPNFEMLDVKIASSLKKIIRNSNFKKRVNLAEQKAQMDDRILRGRQVAFVIYEYFWVTGAHEAVVGYSDLFRITSHVDDVQDFDTRWCEVLLSFKVHPDDIPESLYKMR